MLVRAKVINRDDSDPQVVGYIYNQRIREGQLIELQDPKHFSDKWMEKVDDDEMPKKKSKKSDDKTVKQYNVI